MFEAKMKQKETEMVRCAAWKRESRREREREREGERERERGRVERMNGRVGEWVTG